jgi:hypothetical protein
MKYHVFFALLLKLADFEIMLFSFKNVFIFYIGNFSGKVCFFSRNLKEVDQLNVRSHTYEFAGLTTT